MQFIKTICVLVVLGALTYGAYTTLTGKPKQDPPGESANWDTPPRIELAGGNDVALGPNAAAPNAPAGGSAPRYGATAGEAPGVARIVPGSNAAQPLFSGAAANGAPSSAAAPAGTATTPTVPSSYPSTTAVPGPFDGHGAVHLVSSTASSSVPASSSPNIAPSASQGPTLAAATSPAPPVNAVDAFTKGEAALAQRNYLLALDELSKCYDNPGLPPADVNKVHDLLDQLAGTVIYSREHLIEPAHTVAQGETLQSIAQRHNVSVGLLSKINGIADPLYVPAGTQLKMVKGPFEAIVDKGDGKLVVFCDGLYAGSFPLAPGFEFPEGNYTVEKTEKGLNLSPSNTFAAQPAHRIELTGGVAIVGTDLASWPSGAADPRTGVRGVSLRDGEDLCDILTVGSKFVVRK